MGMKMKTLFLVLTLLVVTVSTEDEISGKTKHVLDVTSDNFTDFIKYQNVRVVYFYKRDMYKLKHFMREFEKSAGVLDLYDVTFGKFDCTKNVLQEYCDEKQGVEDNVYTFRGGHELLELGLNNMFDVNSIVANILQIVLLREVPILQTAEEMQNHMKKHRDGTTDVIITYQKAIGTYEHRIIMEIAFAYQGTFKFTLTTELAAVENFPDRIPEEEAAIWVARCKSAKDNEPCKLQKFKDVMDLASLARWLRVLDLSPSFELKHDVASDGDYNPYEENDIHTVYIFYDTQSAAQVRGEADHLLNAFPALLGILLVDVTQVDATQYGLNPDQKVPTLALRKRDDMNLQFMTDNQDPISFVAGKLSVKTPSSVGDTSEETDSDKEMTPSSGEAEDTSLSDIEKEDDTVARAVFLLKHTEIDRQHVPELTDKTFNMETRDRKLLMVLFHLKFHAPCAAFLRSYVEAAHVLSKKSLYPLAAIDCYDWTDVCASNNVTQWPKLRVYRKGREPVEYKGMLGPSMIVAAITLYMADAPLVLTSGEQAMSFLEGNLPEEIGAVTNISVIGLFNTGEHDPEIAAFKVAAQSLHGKVLFGLATGNTAKEVVSRYDATIPSVIVVKRHDPIETHVIMKNDFMADNISHFVLQERLAVYPELTAANYPLYNARQQPFLILFLKNTESPEYNVLSSLAKSKALPHVTLCWMDVNNGAAAILKYYAEEAEAEGPCLVYLDHKRAAVFLYDGDELTSENVKTWVRDIEKDKLKPYKTLSDRQWKPLNPGYDFLKYMEMDAETRSADPRYSHDHDLDYDDDERHLHGELDEQDDYEDTIRRELQIQKQNRFYKVKDKRPVEESHHMHTEL